MKDKLLKLAEGYADIGTEEAMIWAMFYIWAAESLEET